jgi:hypothetical protein
LKKIDYNAVFYGFAKDLKMRLKKLDLNVNIIYKGECKKNQDAEYEGLDPLLEDIL